MWINGGNAFILRRAMKQSGLDELVVGALRRDRIVYAGFSAAAVIAYSSLKGLDLTDNPEEVPEGAPCASGMVWPWHSCRTRSPCTISRIIRRAHRSA